MSETTCLFCRIASGAIPAAIVHQDDEITAFRDIDPQAPTHILIVPNRHLASLRAAESEAGLLGRLLTTAAALAQREGIADGGYRVVVNTGQHGGQSVDHLHLHLLGGRPMTWPPG
jgi:histidine triad (HIT) family protein